MNPPSPVTLKEVPNNLIVVQLADVRDGDSGTGRYTIFTASPETLDALCRKWLEFREEKRGK